jgi:arylsulfatase A-like enzyme
VRDTVFLAYRDIQRAVRRGRWKMIRYPKVGITQLFDLETDPYETRDLAGDPRHAAKMEELLKLMREQQTLFGDTTPLTVDNPQPSKVDLEFFKKAPSEAQRVSQP